MITNKQKILLFLAYLVLVATFLNTAAVMKLSHDVGSRLAVNVGFVAFFLVISSGFLACALLILRAFRQRPLAPGLPLWLKLADYYAASLIAWGTFVLIFSGETPEERYERWQISKRPAASPSSTLG